MNLLFVTSIVPDGTLGSGYEIANQAIIDGLRRAGATVTVLGFIWPGRKPSEPRTVVLGEVDVRTDQASAFRNLRWLAAAIRHGLPFSSAKMRLVSPERVRAAVEEAGPFDAYVLNSVQFAGAFETVFADRPFMFVAHNVEHETAAENARTAGSRFQRLLFRRESGLLKALEARLCAAARFVFTLAEDDRRSFSVGADRSAALPLITTRHAPHPADRRDIDCDAALIGTWTWQPNRVGLDWFMREVMPHLPAEFRVKVAGSAPADLVRDNPRVAFVGRVADAKDFISSAAVVPLVSRGGTGVQLKTIETFELGLPSVATSSALRGLDRIPENCVVSDDPRGFAQALVRLAAGGGRDLDGRAFYASQRAALDVQIGRGLAAVGHSRSEVYA